MTKYIHLLGLALMLIVASCSADIDVVNPEFKPEMVDISVVANSDSETRLMLDGNRTEWEVGDRITLALTGSTTDYYTFEIASAEDISNEGKTARFSGSVAVGSYTRCTAIYPAITDNGSILSRHNEAVYMTARYDEAVEISSLSASIPMSFSHLMHKVDYNLTLASDYTDTDITKGIAIEMVARSSGGEFSLEQCYNYNIYTGYSDIAAESTSHIADFTQHNFATESIASTLIFPTTIPNAELEFNIYVEGRKAHTIVKSLDRDFTMSAGKSSKINLALSADNKVEEEVVEDNSGGNSGVEFNPDYFIKSWKFIGYSGISWGNYYTISGDGISMQVHFNKNVASEYSLAEGTYTKSTDSYVDDKTTDFRIRSANIGNITDGSITVKKIGDNHIILMELYVNSKLYNIGYYGPLNVDNGGQVGGNSGGNGGGTSSTQPDITLSSLSLNTTTDYHTLEGSNSSGDAITLRINAIDGIASGAYEHIALGYCHYKGYFHASNIMVGGASKSAKSGILYISKSGSATTLHADIAFTDGTTRHFKFEGSINVPVVEGDITLSASKSSIVGNGSDSVKFTVMQDGRDVTNDCTIFVDGSWHSSSFSSTTPGTYEVYATKGSKTSNKITITVTEYKPSSLTLTASKTSIMANGSDSVTFSVKADGATTVTNLCEIYVSGAELNGTTFSTYNAGNYSVYAKYNGVTSNIVTITATAVASGTQIVFAEGVTQQSGWYDVNKKGKGDNGDINMCWAAASSNMIQWWQDRYVAAGNTLPSTAVSGPGTKIYGSFEPYELALMEIYHDQWDNSKGGHPEEAIPWYFEGKLYGGEYASSGSQAYPLTNGGYFSSVWSSIESHIYRGYKHELFPSQYPNMYTYCYNNYYIWGNGSGLQGEARLRKFTELVVEAFDHGIAAMTVSLSENISSLHHAVTLWGYEIDKSTGLLTRVWISDSDDIEKEPKQQLLNEYSVSIGSGNSHIKLSGSTRYGDIWVVSLHPFSGYGSAN
ncbi:MAG: IdeS/Mac family cysteine endopeptidase [Alistipes sp.]|nr:IdeS/Mac family cysteine endopeptidase [Alistipes sp.]